MDKQIDTVAVTWNEIMSRPQFMSGWLDARAGKGFSKEYESWVTRMQFTYERGRQFYFATMGKVAPVIKDKRTGRVNVNQIAVDMARLEGII